MRSFQGKKDARTFRAINGHTQTVQSGVTMIEINYVYRLYKHEKVMAKKATREWQSRVIIHKKNPIFMIKP